MAEILSLLDLRVVACDFRIKDKCFSIGLKEMSYNLYRNKFPAYKFDRWS